MSSSPLQTHETRLVFEALLLRFCNVKATDAEAAWDLLSAAHIVGQSRFQLHCRVHLTMLRFAARRRGGFEVLGQIFRLALVPAGHLFKRLPIGNTGRANVPAFQSMPITAKLSQLIKSADANRQ